MAEVTVTIGGRDFQVVCGEGQEGFLRAAAAMLNEEASKLSQAPEARLTGTRMLLMSGLMLADRTAAMEDQLRASQSGVDYQAKATEAEAKLDAASVEVERLTRQNSELEQAVIAAQAAGRSSLEEARRELNAAKGEVERLGAERSEFVSQQASALEDKARIESENAAKIATVQTEKSAALADRDAALEALARVVQKIEAAAT